MLLAHQRDIKVFVWREAFDIVKVMLLTYHLNWGLICAIFQKFVGRLWNWIIMPFLKNIWILWSFVRYHWMQKRLTYFVVKMAFKGKSKINITMKLFKSRANKPFIVQKVTEYLFLEKWCYNFLLGFMSDLLGYRFSFFAM